MKTISEISRNLNANIQTRQITNAMYLLSASQIRRMSGSIDYIQNYMKQLRLTLRDVLLRSGGIRHAFIRHHKNPKASAFIVISSDKSLCGAFNIKVASLAQEMSASVNRAVFFTAGKQGEAILRSRGFEVRKNFDISSANVSMNIASAITDEMIERFLDEEFDEVFLVFTRYLDQLHQEPECIRLFPVSLDDLAFETDSSPQKENFWADTIFEPGIEDVFEALANEYVTGIVHSGLIQSATSEHIARMNAMQSATRNADKMIASLRLQYNSARQLAITNEISEIFAASSVSERGI